MKWASIIMKFLFSGGSKRNKTLKDTIAEAFAEVTHKGKRLLTLSLIAFAAVLLFIPGFFIGLLNLTGQYDRQGYVAFTATFGAGLALMVIAGGMIAYVAKAWSGVSPVKKAKQAKRKVEEKIEERISERRPDSLETALSLLVMDYIREREEKRRLRASMVSARRSPLTSEERMELHEEPGIEREPHREPPEAYH